MRASRLLLLLLLLPLTQAALCGDTAPKNQQEIIQEQACVKNIQNGDADKAETRCEICLEYNERNAECLNGLGLVWYLRGVDEKARDYFKTAIRENNDFAQARNNLGVLDFVKGEFAAARKMFASAVEVDPRYLDGRYNLALSNLRLGQRAQADGKDPTESYAEAEDNYRKIFELYPQHIPSYHDMGVIMTYRAEKEQIENKRQTYIQDAEQFFVRCLDLEPTHEMCHGNIAHLFLAVGRYDEALFHYVQCLSAAKAQEKLNPTCAVELKQAYSGSQLQSESLQKFMTQLAENPGYAPGHYGFCIALFEKGLVDQAVTECENTLKLDETLCLAHYQLGIHFKSVLDKDNALFHCRKMIGCAGETRYEAETEECKEIVRTLEVQ
jgi:tetratricopeptide (TPR) repeat protein